MTDTATSYPLPRPALVWDRDDFRDAAEAIEQHPNVRKIRDAMTSIMAGITASNIDLLAPHIEDLQQILEGAKDAAAAEYDLTWARRIRL